MEGRDQRGWRGRMEREGKGGGRGEDGMVTNNCNKASRAIWEQVTQKV